MPFKTIYDRREWAKKYYLKNKDRITRRNEKWRLGNIEHVRAMKRAYYLKNSEKVKSGQRRKRIERKPWFYKNIEELRCCDCGISFKGMPRLADFHHMVKASDNMCLDRALIHSYNRFCYECNKGVFLCPNCHRLGHIREG